ncbi:MAG: HD-GYP domain-containing protein [Planctomycetota bacterium]|jgi:HD-GYP domain-containing protein (c-di-GMP phosphodiesterase class II)
MDHEVVSALLKLVQDRDAETAAHTWRVALYTLALAEAEGIVPGERHRFLRAAVLHDIGKIDVPRQIIAKPGRLTRDEYRVVQTHARLGFERLRCMGEQDPLVLEVVLGHHERLDGSGYPDGLAGERIPLAARWFAIIDSFDAMTSRRPYRQTVGEVAADRAIEELQGYAGIWYCPRALDAFVSLYRAGGLSWILHLLNDDESLIELPPAPDAETLSEARRRVAAALSSGAGP